jgi:hypothetical protein
MRNKQTHPHVRPAPREWPLRWRDEKSEVGATAASSDQNLNDGTPIRYFDIARDPGIPSL